MGQCLSQSFLYLLPKCYYPFCRFVILTDKPEIAPLVWSTLKVYKAKKVAFSPYGVDTN